MEKTIQKASLGEAVAQACEKYRNFTCGAPLAPSPRVADMNSGCFGMSVCLVDGTRFDAGDTQVPFAMGSMLRVPVYLQLLTQMGVDELVGKMRFEKCPCRNSSAGDDKPAAVRPKGVHAKSLRMISLVSPQGDADGKMQIISDMMIGLMGASPLLDDDLYKANVARSAEKDVINVLANAGYELYDATDVALGLYDKLDSMLVTTGQIATMGATIAAGGYNPVTQTPVFDCELAAPLTAMIATCGHKHFRKTWMLSTGVPAVSSYGGGFLAVVPGFGSIAAFSPDLAEDKVPVRAAMAVRDVLQRFGISAFACSPIVVK